MYIKQLEIDNFKSFATKVDIPLLKGFTTVSGPNGSGKSNIIDSILFALGLSTTRTLRAENISHLISTFNKRNEAIVKVTFSEVENSEDFSVARRIKKTSGGFASTYYLNDKVVTLSEIHAAIEKFNITPNSYNVIMQGDVTSIIKCSANDRRKIIDEIAGVADFDRRIDAATNELNTVEDRVEKSNFILNEVENRLVQLEEEKEVALKYQKLKEEKSVYDSQINSVKFFDIKRKLEKAHENILEFTKKQKEEKVKVEDLTEKLDLIKGEYQEIEKLVKEKGEAKQLEIKKEAEEVKGKIARKESAIVWADKQIQDGLKSIENAKNGIEVHKQKINDFKLKIELKQQEINEIEKLKVEKQSELTKILEEMTGLDQTANQYIEKRNILRTNLEALKDRETQLIQKKVPLESELATLQKNLEQAKEQLQKLEDFKNNFDAEKDRLEVQKEELTKELQDYKDAQQAALKDLDTVNSELSDLTYDINMAYRKIASLEAQKQAIASTNVNHAVDTVMSARLQGVHAPIYKLGSVNKEYSTALEVAIGGRMSHIVVEDEHVASVAIEMLRSSNAGRATFVPLNKVVKAPKSLHLPKESGVIDFAINLIDFDDEYLNAFYYAVGETLVVEDFESARNLMGKYRIVTLKGDIFEKSGSITGGTAKKSGLKFSQNDDEELLKYQNKLKELEARKIALENKKLNLEEKLSKIRINYSNTMTEANKAKLELDSLLRQAENNDKSIQEKIEWIKVSEPDVEKITKQLDKTEEDHIKIADELLDIQAEIKEIDKLMNDEALKELKEKTNDIEAEISRLTTNLLTMNNDINEFNRHISFESGLIDTKNDNIKETEKNNIDRTKEKEIYQTEIVSLKKILEELETQIAEIADKLSELIKQRDEISSRLMAFEKEKHIKESDLEKIAEQIESFKTRRKELEPELDNARAELENAGVDINTLTPSELSIEEINAKIQRLQKKMDELGDVNMRAIADYERVLARETELKNQLETLTKERVEILERMQGYENMKKEAFMKTYNAINTQFKEIFHQLSDGEGTLVLGNPEDPLNGGLTIDAQPRDKEMQRLESMSGGEQSLTALAFVFAIQRYLPAPFYALDEVDASLDGINVEKLAHLVQTQAENTQFIVVSHRKPMIESAHRTIGVTQKERGKTSVTGVKLRD